MQEPDIKQDEIRTVKSDMPSALQTKYEILGEIGRGGMAVVYKAKHKLTGNLVAIKILHDQDENSLRRFREEARTATKLAHPHIVAMRDFDIADKTAYIVMEHIEGKTLAQVLDEEGVIPAERVRKIASDICDALNYVHGKNIVHRDIKPSNVLLEIVDGREVAKLVDFGLAKSVDMPQQLTQTGQILGTPMYLSPEQCMGQPATNKSDIYSVGCLMYEAISGKPPLAGENFLETVHLRATSKPIALRQSGFDTVSERLDRAIMACLQTRPEDRPASAAELMSMLEGHQEPARPTRRPSMVMYIAFLVCFIIGMGSLLFTSFARFDVNTGTFNFADNGRRQLPNDQMKLWEIASRTGDLKLKEEALLKMSQISQSPGDQATALTELAFVKIKQKNENAALGLIDTALERWHKAYPNDDPYLAYGCTRAAEAYTRMGLDKDAAALLKESARILSNVKESAAAKTERARLKGAQDDLRVLQERGPSPD